MRRTRIKICGMTSAEDALAAVDAGAERIGFVFAESPRRISGETAAAIRRALPEGIGTVVVFMNQGYEEVARLAAMSGVDEFQFHGAEEPSDYMCQGRAVIRCVRVLPDDTRETLAARVADASRTCMSVLLDPGAGSGRTFDWRLAAGLGRWVMLSGGLTPDNVREAIRIVQPWGVDVSSGVEISPGRKDADKMRRFVESVRAADAE